MSLSKKEIKEHLFLAVEQGNEELVEDIIESYPELIEVRSQLGWPPALFAARYGYKNMLEYLHKKGARLEYERGYNTLHVACYGADPETIRYLFEVGKVNPNPDT
jgi:ankyrin repeat protein